MMNEPTPKEIKETRLYAEWGLTDEEYHQIETIYKENLIIQKLAYSP